MINRKSLVKPFVKLFFFQKITLHHTIKFIEEFLEMVNDNICKVEHTFPTGSIFLPQNSRYLTIKRQRHIEIEKERERKKKYL